tara:strand:- start:1747 stop:2598 length:852 start_codon:yes stop_codon:yes gene_type:complete
MSVLGSFQDWSELAQTLGVQEAISSSTEDAYQQVWMHHVAGQRDPGVMAVQGGLLADRLAWVFVAGYQSALRHTFMDQTFAGWGAFAVSEDRRGDPPLPGVDYEQVEDSFVLSGHKTWVATVNSIEHLVIKAGRGERALYFNIPRYTEGLDFSARNANFLGEMSQGSVHLVDVKLPADAALDAGAVAQFGQREALYIYLAFLAYAGRTWLRDSAQQDCLRLIQRLQRALSERSLPIAEVKALDLAVQGVLAAVGPAAGANNERWGKDQRLISMYSPGIQQRES